MECLTQDHTGDKWLLWLVPWTTWAFVPADLLSALLFRDAQPSRVGLPSGSEFSSVNLASAGNAVTTSSFLAFM